MMEFHKNCNVQNANGGKIRYFCAACTGPSLENLGYLEMYRVCSLPFLCHPHDFSIWKSYELLDTSHTLVVFLALHFRNEQLERREVQKMKLCSCRLWNLLLLCF